MLYIRNELVSDLWSLLNCFSILNPHPSQLYSKCEWQTHFMYDKNVKNVEFCSFRWQIYMVTTSAQLCYFITNHFDFKDNHIYRIAMSCSSLPHTVSNECQFGQYQNSWVLPFLSIYWSYLIFESLFINIASFVVYHHITFDLVGDRDLNLVINWHLSYYMSDVYYKT